LLIEERENKVERRRKEKSRSVSGENGRRRSVWWCVWKRERQKDRRGARERKREKE
jgi:hypothetical protein